MHNQLVYWEEQGNDKLCGVHALNSLLQGPYYDEFQLAQLALEIDERESNLMGGGIKSGPSYNVADDGNFSIQVLNEAMNKIGQLECSSINSKENRSMTDLTKEQAFICNNQLHWLTIRNVYGIWYNLNSTNEHGPQIISEFYLSAVLNSVRENGYTIFVVRGVFPNIDPLVLKSQALKHQKFFTVAELDSMNKYYSKFPNYEINIGGSDERDIRKAIEASKKDKQPNHNFAENIDEQLQKVLMESQKEYEEEEMKKIETTEPKVNLFSGQGVSIMNESDKGLKVTKYLDVNENEDVELWESMILSMQSQYEQDDPQTEENFTVSIRFPNGSRVKHTFSAASTIEDLYNFSFVSNPEKKKQSISTEKL